MKEDKIFNNKFNAGEVEHEVFAKMSIKSEFLSGDAYDEYNDKRLQEDIYTIFVSSKYHEDYSKNKKVPKSEVREIYCYFEERLLETVEISAVDKFIAIADFMSISYDVLYSELAPIHKEKLLRDLDRKYAIFTKRKIKRLF
jgi:hypothetical protein